MLYERRLAMWVFGWKEACSADVLEYELAKINPTHNVLCRWIEGGKVELIARSIFFSLAQ